jgi:hypothetical protein
MSSNDDNSGTLAALEMERALLGALCQLRQDDPRRSQILQLLPRYNWISGDHRAVYDALAQWTAEPSEIRNGIAARLTRLGFPDVDIQPFFEPTGDLSAIAIEWLREQVAHDPSGSDSTANGIHRIR